jgi:SAM-dependent methyltransferase
MISPSTHAIGQYAATTGNLTARIALHTAYGTNPQSWFAWLDERLPLAGEVLEVGGGTGMLWRHVDHAGRGLKLTLTDFSPAMCEQLRQVPGATVRQCDATDLPFADGSFDTVVANHMLYHLDDPADGLREFARVLRPGGRIAVAVNGAEHLEELNLLGPVMGRPGLTLRATQNGFTAQTGPACLAQFFGDVSVERYPDGLEITEVEPVLAYLDSLANGPLTTAERSAARDYIQAQIDAEGCYRVRKHTVLMTGIR